MRFPRVRLWVGFLTLAVALWVWWNAFVNFGDIKGESTDKDHKDWVTISTFDH